MLKFLLDQTSVSPTKSETFLEMVSLPCHFSLEESNIASEKNAFYFFSPTLQTFRLVRAPIEAIVIEESREGETLCMIHNVPYLVPDKYLKNVGYN